MPYNGRCNSRSIFGLLASLAAIGFVRRLTRAFGGAALELRLKMFAE